MLSEGTIIALATPQGSGAIGIIRISGPQAFEKTKLFFKPKGALAWDELKPNQTLLSLTSC